MKTLRPKDIGMRIGATLVLFIFCAQIMNCKIKPSHINPTENSSYDEMILADIDTNAMFSYFKKMGFEYQGPVAHVVIGTPDAHIACRWLKGNWSVGCDARPANGKYVATWWVYKDAHNLDFVHDTNDTERESISALIKAGKKMAKAVTFDHFSY